jgi:hypothetical protein
MQLTQIFFDWIQADGRTWAAVIAHDAGGRTFHNLRGIGVTRKSRANRMLDASVAEADRNVVPSNGMVVRSAVSNRGGDVCPGR